METSVIDKYTNILLLHICYTYAAGHVAVFASPMYVTVTPLLHSREAPDYILVTPLLHNCYAFCGILCGFHNVAFCPIFTLWHFVRDSFVTYNT